MDFLTGPVCLKTKTRLLESHRAPRLRSLLFLMICMTLASYLSDASVLTDKTKLVLAQEKTKTKNFVEKKKSKRFYRKVKN